MTDTPTRIRFGLAGLTAQSPSGSSEEFHRELEYLVGLGRLAETEGLDSLWLSEHHFSTDLYLPSVLPVMASIARETERVTVATNVALAPMYHPLRLAEDCAVVDHLSSGRFMLGLGLGYRAEEFEGLGVDRRRRGADTESLLQLLRRAWAGESVSVHPDGRAVTVTPPPFQAGGPPLLVGSLAEVGVRRAARYADGWIAPLLSKVSHAERRLGWISDERDGRLDGFHVVLTFSTFVAGTDAWSRVADGALHVENQYRVWLQEADDIPALRGQPSSHQPADIGAPEHFICGTPDEVFEQLAPWARFLRQLPGGIVPHMTLRLTWPSVDPRDNTESVRLFAREVVPRLQEV